jgi:hypothetical protein
MSEAGGLLAAFAEKPIQNWHKSFLESVTLFREYWNVFKSSVSFV